LERLVARLEDALVGPRLPTWMSVGSGDTTVVQQSAGKGRDRTRVVMGSGNVSSSATGAPLLRPEQITEMAPGTLVVRIAHERPLLVKVAPWYRSRRLKRRAGGIDQTTLAISTHQTVATIDVGGLA